MSKTHTELFDLSGRAALVTGASSGLGRRMALVLARAGARVGVAARRVDRLTDLVEEIEAEGGRALALSLDVTDPQSVTRTVDICETELGPLRILINNAGVASRNLALDVSDEDWRKVMATNLDGVWHVAQAVGRKMVLHGHGGAIVNIASMLGLRARAGLLPYNASKAAVISLTQTLACEWAQHGVRVNAIAPGYIITDINRAYVESPAGQDMLGDIPLKRFGQVEDLDGLVLLLSSDASAFMTGAVLVADGGHTLSV